LREVGESIGLTAIVFRQAFPGEVLLGYSFLALMCSDSATLGYDSGEELQMVFCLATVLTF